MDHVAKKAVIDGKDYDLPKGVTALSEDGLFLVDWSLIEVAKEVTEEEFLANENFSFFNPRHLGQYETEKGDSVEVHLGQGFDKEHMRELLGDISKNGLDYPLLGYWVAKDDQIKVRVNDGERRWLCLNRLIEKNDQVWSAEHASLMPAKEVYSKILCRVKSMTEEEAMERACTVSETSVKWGDAAVARFIKLLYKKGGDDDKLCKMFNKGKLWLADTCSLNELDEFCFSFLLAGKINRKVALDLIKIKDVKTRQNWLKAAWKDVIEGQEKTKHKNEKLLEKAENKEALAEAELEVAKSNDESEEEIADLQEEVDKAAVKTKKRKQASAASARPVVKSANLRRASNGLLNNALRAPKIKKQLKSVEEMIENKDESVVDLKTLRIVATAYQCILDGEEDVNNVLQKLNA